MALYGDSSSVLIKPSVVIAIIAVFGYSILSKCVLDSDATPRSDIILYKGKNIKYNPFTRITPKRIIRLLVCYFIYNKCFKFRSVLSI
jgi:hypothetical protein